MTLAGPGGDGHLWVATPASPIGRAVLGKHEGDVDDVTVEAELRSSMLVVGSGAEFPNWDSEWRERLVINLELLVRQLWHISVRDIFIDGSFVADKDHPNDIDGYFECELHELSSGELQRKLNMLDPHKTWTWDPGERRPHRGYPKKQLPMWHHYRVELYPHVGQLSTSTNPRCRATSGTRTTVSRSAERAASSTRSGSN